MRLRFLLSIVAVPLLIAAMARADTAAQAGASAPGGQDCAPALSLVVPAPPAFCAADVPAPRLLPLAPPAHQATYVLCGSCSGSCVGIPVNSNCVARGINQTGRCEINGSCGQGLGLWCQCIVGSPP